MSPVIQVKLKFGDFYSFFFTVLLYNALRTYAQCYARTSFWTFRTLFFRFFVSPSVLFSFCWMIFHLAEPSSTTQSFSKTVRSAKYANVRFVYRQVTIDAAFAHSTLYSLYKNANAFFLWIIICYECIAYIQRYSLIKDR